MAKYILPAAFCGCAEDVWVAADRGRRCWSRAARAVLTRCPRVLEPLWIQGGLWWLKVAEFTLLGDGWFPAPLQTLLPILGELLGWATAGPLWASWEAWRYPGYAPTPLGGRWMPSKEEELLFLPLPYPERSPHHLLEWRSCWSSLGPYCGTCRPVGVGALAGLAASPAPPGRAGAKSARECLHKRLWQVVLLSSALVINKSGVLSTACVVRSLPESHWNDLRCPSKY